MHEVLINRLGGLSLPRKSVVRLTDRPDMTLDVYEGRKTTTQHLFYNSTRRGWSGSVKVLGKLSVPRIWKMVEQEPIALAVGAGEACLDIFSSRLSILFFLSPLGDGPI